jgi:hypothetical protein
VAELGHAGLHGGAKLITLADIGLERDDATTKTLYSVRRLVEVVRRRQRIRDGLDVIADVARRWPRAAPVMNAILPSRRLLMAPHFQVGFRSAESQNILYWSRLRRPELTRVGFVSTNAAQFEYVHSASRTSGIASTPTLSSSWRIRSH